MKQNKTLDNIAEEIKVLETRMLENTPFDNWSVGSNLYEGTKEDYLAKS